ncbi:MAG: 50S ribosomal protein L23 [bacterium]|nr:50S ribosomal protein L23 [bacterium]
MKKPYEIIRRQVVSEKATDLGKRGNQYVFEVARGANKIEIGRAVEAIYGVHVEGVQVMNRPGKRRRRGLSVGRVPGYRRAVVRLKAGESISVT